MKYVLIILILSLCFSSAFAQKDAPIAGHAATLVDLLKKDYNAIDLDSRNEEISRDRTHVIAIFKTYLSDLREGAYQIDNNSVANLKNKDTAFNKVKKEFATYSAVMVNANTRGESEAYEVTERSLEISGRLEEAKKEYFNAKWEYDKAELSQIRKIYLEKHKNQYLVDVLDKFLAKYKGLQDGQVDKFSSVNTMASIQKSIPFIGGEIAFETVIDGLSRFMAKRIKEELTTYVIGRVKEWLENPGAENPFVEFKVLLPRTSNYLLGFKADKITHFPNEIKQYIEDDLNHLLEHAANLKETPRVQKLVKNHPELSFALEAVELIPNISKIKHPSDYFTFLENSKTISDWKIGNNPNIANLANSIYLTSLLSRSLLVTNNGELRFAGVDFMTSYAAEKSFFMLYAGFLHQQNLKYYQISFTGNAWAFKLEDQIQKMVSSTVVAELEDNQKVIMAALTEASKNAETIFTTGTSIRKANKAGTKIEPETVHAFLESIINYSDDVTGSAGMVLDKLVQNYNKGLAADKIIPSIKLREQFNPYFSIARTTNEVMLDLQKKNIATALIKVLELSSNLVQSNQSVLIADITKNISQLSVAESSERWLALVSALNKANSIEDVKKHVNSTSLAELKKISLFYQTEFSATPKLTDLEKLYDFCFNASHGTFPLGAELPAIKAIMADKEVHQIIVSYYTGIIYVEALDKLKRELENVKVYKKDNSNVTLFNSIEITQLTTLLNAYIEDFYKYHFLRNTDSEIDKKQLAEKQRTIERWLHSYIGTLPQKFDLQVHPQVISLVHFVNDMAVAENAEHVEEAIEAFALPAGSFAIKRSTKHNFAINSYPGILPAVDWAFREGQAEEAFSIGFTAPIGINYSWGTKNEGSLGLFIPVFDIGAVTRLRLDNASTTKSLPEFNFRNLLSPGLFVSYGFPKSPLSLNFGAQYGPELKEILENGNKVSYESFRLGIGVVLDIPLLNLHTRPW